jgi:hypothetical protein
VGMEAVDWELFPLPAQEAKTAKTAQVKIRLIIMVRIRRCVAPPEPHRPRWWV